MSSLFSDPQWQRGTTLLNGEPIELDVNNAPVAGGEVIGSIKVFQDVDPVTKRKLSNRLVYCVAARYVGSSTTFNASGADRGKTFLLDSSNPTGTFQTAAVVADSNAYKAHAVLDEYITTTIRPNDIVWLVIKGPATVNKATGTALVAGAATMLTTGGATTAWTTTNVPNGYALAAAASADTTARVYIVSDEV
jgi:hypothetical protein